MEFKFDLRDYLAAAGDPPVRSLEDILERGLYHDALGAIFRASNDAREGSEDHRKALERRGELKEKLLKTMKSERLDVIVYPTLRVKPARVGDPQTGSSCMVSAHSGLPAFSMPAGFTRDGVPVGIELLGKEFEEGKLIAMAYAYEQAARPRRPPARTPSLASGQGLSRAFTVEGGFEGSALLDVPTQTLRYELQWSGLLAEEIVDLKLHREENGGSGPVVALLGESRRGEVAIRNEDLEALLDGKVYFTLYTREQPLGAARAWTKPLY
jgi:hypothetical protein